MSEANQMKVVTVVSILLMALLMSFVTVRDYKGVRASDHCATCSP